MRCDWCGRFRSEEQVHNIEEHMHLTLYGDLVQTWELICKECWAKHSKPHGSRGYRPDKVILDEVG